MAEVNAQWGKAYDSPVDSFDYDKAPDRGWQEGRKDFSHKVGKNPLQFKVARLLGYSKELNF